MILSRISWGGVLLMEMVSRSYRGSLTSNYIVTPMLTCRTIERFDTELQIVANCELDQLHRLIGAQISSRSSALARSDGSGDACFARTSTLTKSSVFTSIPPSELRGWGEEAH